MPPSPSRPPLRRASRRADGHASTALPETEQAVVQIRAARTSGIRGALAVHCWLVLKPQGQAPFERWDVVGRRARTGWIGLQRNARLPGAGWGGRRGWVVLDRRGPEAAAALVEVMAQIAAYPQRQRYRSWPGPNCNTFVAHLARSVPALAIALPPLAIGKDYLPDWRLFARAPSGTGWQLSLFGLGGVMVALEEGLELTVGGLVFGCRCRPPRLLLPGLGAVGLERGHAHLNSPFSPTG